MNEEKKEFSKQNIDSLIKIAIYLEGIKQGRGGNIQPLGVNDIEQLWNAISLLNDDLNTRR